MTAKGDDPRYHWVLVSRDADNEVDTIRFQCDAPQDALCRNYASCECEVWTDELHGEIPAPSHEDMPQPECWMLPWFNDAIGTHDVHEWIDLYDGNSPFLDPVELHTGPVTVSWNGEMIAWAYAPDPPMGPPAEVEKWLTS